MLSTFAKGATYGMTIDMRDKGNVLVAETAEKMIDCADFLTGTETQTLQQMHDASAFFACMADAVLKLTSHPESDFVENYYTLVNTATAVTENYHEEIARWENSQGNDQELVSIINSHLSQFDQLVNDALKIDAPENYQEALDLYIQSLDSERGSYATFRNFVETGDPKLNKTSIDLLSNATEYELESFALVEAERDTPSSPVDSYSFINTCLSL
jgi:hypothetical protein